MGLDYVRFVGYGKDLGFFLERSGVLLRDFKKRGDMGDVKITGVFMWRIDWREVEEV